MGQGDVGNGSVEHLHESGHGHGEGDEPGVVARPPDGLLERDRRCGGHKFLLSPGRYANNIHACMYVVKRGGSLRMPSMHARRPGMPNRRNPRSSTVSRQQLRTETTRRKLLGAAERIFARSGFEAARLEDIAALAGYTRGAFYANFEGKEDIFFAL